MLRQTVCMGERESASSAKVVALLWIVLLISAAVIVVSVLLIAIADAGNWLTVISSTCTLVATSIALLAIRRAEATSSRDE